mgnify:CR=1 FL=1
MPLDANIDTNEAKLIAALTSVDKRIESLVAALASDGNGRFLSDSIAIEQAINVRKDISVAMLEYNLVASDVSTSLDGAAKIARADYAAIGIDSAFSESDASLIQAMTDNTYNNMIAYGDAATASMSEAVLNSVAAGGSKADAMLIVQQMTLGKTAANGKPLLNYATTIAETAYMETHSTATLALADDAGVTHWKYSGTLVRDSRPWCVSHLNKTYNKEEIQAWNNSTWAGKKAGDPFITRGGWNCRHRFQPTLEGIE